MYSTNKEPLILIIAISSECTGTNKPSLTRDNCNQFFALRKLTSITNRLGRSHYLGHSVIGFPEQRKPNPLVCLVLTERNAASGNEIGHFVTKKKCYLALIILMIALKA